MHAIEDHPDRGPAIDGLEPYRIARSRRHRIVYRFDDADIEVVRILHESMDLKRHLP